MTTDEIRYKLYRFLSYYVSYVYSTATTTLPYPSRNFWLVFCRNTSLNLTETSLNNFMKKFLIMVDVAKANNQPLLGYMLSEDYVSYFNDAFNQLNVTGALTTSSNTGGYLRLTASNGSTYDLALLANYPRLNFSASQEIKYAEIAYPTTSFDNLPSGALTGIHYMCGPDSYLTLNGTKFTINGSGETYGLQAVWSNNSPFKTGMNATTLIINSNITKMKNHSTYVGNYTSSGTSFTATTFVFQHSNSDSITLESGWIPAGKSSSSKPTFNIYTDNDTIKNYNYSSNITVNIYPLSDWSG